MMAQLRHWVVPTLRDQGWRTLRRTIEVGQRFASAHREAAGGGAFWHVHAVAVEPTRQHRGVGTRLLSEVFAELHGPLLQERPAPVVLSTQREQNVHFYRRFGFESTGTFRMGDGAGFQSWCMRQRVPQHEPT